MCFGEGGFLLLPWAVSGAVFSLLFFGSRRFWHVANKMRKREKGTEVCWDQEMEAEWVQVPKCHLPNRWFL